MTYTTRELLGGLIIILVLAWFARGIMTRKFHFYWFMIWNMFLAAVQLLPLWFLVNITNANAAWDILLSGAWLLFLPNVYYLLTDFMHLNPAVLVNKRGNGSSPSATYSRGDPWYLVDSLLLLMTSLFAVVVGGFALNNYYQFLKVDYHPIANLVMGLVIVLCAVGVYIGRFGRWNSWDALSRPHRVLSDFFGLFRKSSEARSLGIYVVTISIFELFSWALIYYLVQ